MTWSSVQYSNAEGAPSSPPRSAWEGVFSRQAWALAFPFRKGQEMGWFEHGSTISVLAQPGMVLVDGIQPGLKIRMGEPLIRLDNPAPSVPQPWHFYSSIALAATRPTCPTSPTRQTKLPSSLMPRNRPPDKPHNLTAPRPVILGHRQVIARQPDGLR